MYPGDFVLYPEDLHLMLQVLLWVLLILFAALAVCKTDDDGDKKDE